MLDAEDALALTEEAAERGREGAVERAVDRRLVRRRTRRRCASIRPPGLNLETTVPGAVLAAVGARGALRPTAPSRSTASCSPRSSTRRRSTWSTACSRRPSARWACRSAASGSRTSSSPAGARRSCRRSPRARPTDCARSCSGSRTTPRTWGCRPSPTTHPLADWARAEIVDVAGAVGVPAIDGMTLDYPVADPALDAAGNRAPLPGADDAGPSRCRPRPRLRDAGQVGRAPGAAVRGAPRVRGRHAARGPRGGGGQAQRVRHRRSTSRARAPR